MVIPAHDERERLPRCVSRLAHAARLVEVPVTVVVVLDACTDGSADVLPGHVRTVRITSRNVGVARAAGFRAVALRADAGTWFATTDADSCVPITWLAKQVAHYRAGVEVAIGTVTVDWREHSSATRLHYDQLYAVGDGDVHGHVHGANLGMRADTYWQAGGFRSLPCEEDIDLVDRFSARGAVIAWDPHNPVLTSDRRLSRARGGFGDHLRSVAAGRRAQHEIAAPVLARRHDESTW
ncbi:glycosyltransferase [Mycobacterium hodleri]|uniref:4,4'-diaponeurosporenoate glycosyltransferase n=1 Tax=Mycolicibacterium hodleri TaxID=49897 RepID=A0A502DRQ0_9MYCO|nr:glycosyltransferase [Mycolicibacterium hodleri]